MPRDPTLVIHVRCRRPPVMIAARAESTCKASVQRGCNLCVRDCMDCRFASSLRFASRMHRGRLLADVSPPTQLTGNAPSRSRRLARSVSMQVGRLPGQVAGRREKLRSVARPLSFSASSCQRHACGRIGLLAMPHVEMYRLSSPAADPRRLAGGSAESLVISVVTALLETAVAKGISRTASVLRPRAPRLRLSCAGAGTGQVCWGRAVP